MNYKYANKEFRLELNDDGKIECRDLGIRGDTFDDIKKLIREQVEKEKAMPRVKILLFEEHGYDRDSKSTYFEGTSSLKSVGSSSFPQIWVSYTDERGRNQREKRSTWKTYLDTAENRKVLDEYVALNRRIAEMEEQAEELLKKIEIVKAIKV